MPLRRLLGICVGCFAPHWTFTEPQSGQGDIPAMSEGDVWEETVVIPVMEEAGYYLAALSADIQGPEVSPYTIDRVYGQAWMLVSNEDGQLTDFFDETVFPETAFPQPGPFITEVPAVLDDDGEPTTHNDIYLNVVYYHGWQEGYRPAVGAQIWGYLFEFGSSGGKDRIERTVRRTESWPSRARRTTSSG